MKLLIDIPDEYYKSIKNTAVFISGQRSGKSFINHLCNAVANGIPLPKGHGNLIQREEAETIFRNAKMALYKQSRTEQIKDFQTRESMLLNAEQFVHMIKPIIEADKAEGVIGMKCKKGYEVKPLKSPIGWYVGTLDPEGFPNCRISTEYAKSEELAKILILDRQFGCIENEFCNGGEGCFHVE